ncbi:hypothetical protein [Micromonospora sp. NPDC049891]|uniref:hypothetical protein n=1 Tax=Micromonospora sp. NPDC049891 TaxID=3155655 RepID=UPI0033F52591
MSVTALAGLVRERAGQPNPVDPATDPDLRDRLTTLLSRVLLDLGTSGTPDAALLRTLADLHWTCAAGDADIVARPGLALYAAIPAPDVPAPVWAALQRVESALRIPLRAGLAAMRGYQRTGDPEALRHGLFWMLHTALAPTGPRHHSYALSNLHQCFAGLARDDGDIGLLDLAIAFGRIAADALPSGDTVTTSLLCSLSETLRDRYEHRGVLADLDEAVAFGERGVAGPAADATQLGVSLATVSIALHDRWVETGDQEDLTRALAASRRAMRVMPPEAPERGRVLVNALAVFGQAAHTGMSADGFRTVLLIGGRALDELGPSSPHRPIVLGTLADIRILRHLHERRPADLNGAVRLARAAVAGIDVTDRHAGRLRATLARALHRRHQATGRIEDLDEAVAVLSHTGAAPPGELGEVLRSRFTATGDTADIDASIAVHRRALESSGPGDRARFGRLLNLGGALHARHRYGRDSAGLDEAIDVYRAALAGLGEHDVNRVTALVNLAEALLSRFTLSGDLTDLTTAVVLCRAAVAQAPQWHPERPLFLSNLGNLLRTRHDVTGQAADLDEAISAGRDAVAAAGTVRSDRGQYLHNLGIALVRSYKRDGDGDTLAEAVTCLHEAGRAAPGQAVDRALYRGSLAGALLTRFERGGDTADLTVALDQLRHAVEETAPAPHHQALHLCNLAAAVHMARDRPEVTVPEDTLILAERAVAASPPGTPHHARSLTALGRALWNRPDPDRARAVDCWRAVTGTAAASVAERFEAARLWVTAASTGEAETAIPAFAATVDLLPEFVWHGLDRETRERHLTTVQGLGTGAAAFALRAGRVEDAVTWLEQSRNVLWGQMLQLRDDHAGLRRARPGLATRLDALRVLLD